MRATAPKDRLLSFQLSEPFLGCVRQKANRGGCRGFAELAEKIHGHNFNCASTQWIAAFPAGAV